MLPLFSKLLLIILDMSTEGLLRQRTFLLTDCFKKNRFFSTWKMHFLTLSFAFEFH